MKKKAQGGINAAILVAIIAGLILLYIVFLPVSDRERLITGKEGSKTTGAEKSNVLLRVFPGELSTTRGLEDEKSIPNIFLVETTNAMEIQSVNPFIVRNGVFDKKIKILDFELDDPDNTDNVIISFTAKKRQGILTIRLNNEIIFENELASEMIEPVKLENLGKKNALEFSVSPVGIRFWATNEYSFENIKIIGDITDTSKQQSNNIFAISDSEFSSIEKATLKFTPYCGNVNELGSLDIFVNNKNLFSAVPVCDNPYRQSMPKSMLNEGENSIVFKTNKGSYSVERITVALDFKEPQLKTYFFNVDNSTFNDIIKGKTRAELTIKFIDDIQKKRIKLNINGFLQVVETGKMEYSRIISNTISEGNNFVRLEPFEDIEIAELKVELV